MGMPNRDPDRYRKYMREYMKRRYHQRMAEYRERFGGKCQRCGSTDQLEFDHIDRTTKVDVIGALACKSDALVEAELKKCQLLCRDCHLKKGREAGDVPAAVEHGTDGMYQRQACRCDACRAAHSKIMKEYQPRRKSRRKIGREAQTGRAADP